MSRYLFVAPPLVGHAAPAVAVARELDRRGQETAWVVAGDAVPAILGPGARVYDAPLPSAVQDALERPPGGGALELLRGFWDVVVTPLARAMRPVVAAAADDFRPDGLVVDQHAFAGAVEGRLRGLPWATSAATPQATARGILDAIGARAWLAQRFAELHAEAGLVPAEDADLSPRLVLVYSSPELAGGGPYPPSFRFVGPPLEELGADDFPWEGLDPARTLVYVTLGTTVSRTNASFYTRVFDALAPLPLQAVVVAPEAAVNDAPPPNVIVRPWVPQVAILRRAAALVTHGGSNTVGQALALGVPIVVAPDTFDRGHNAAHVVRLGAGLRVRSARLRVDELRDAVERVLAEPAFRARALEAGATLRLGGAQAAADALAELVGEAER